MMDKWYFRKPEANEYESETWYRNLLVTSASSKIAIPAYYDGECWYEMASDCKITDVIAWTYFPEIYNATNTEPIMSELKLYAHTADGYTLDLVREDDGTDTDDLARYEVVFKVEEERYYCFVDALNMDEALGIFFRNHPHIAYDMIIDHMEV